MLDIADRKSQPKSQATLNQAGAVILGSTVSQPHSGLACKATDDTTLPLRSLVRTTE